MTGKRFKFNGATNCIEYDDKSILLDSYGEDIEDLLNELYEENQRLKNDKTNLHRTMSRDRVRYCQFKDKVFSCIDKNLEKDKLEYEMTYEDYLNGRIEVLEELKKELLND